MKRRDIYFEGSRLENVVQVRLNVEVALTYNISSYAIMQFGLTNCNIFYANVIFNMTLTMCLYNVN